MRLVGQREALAWKDRLVASTVVMDRLMTENRSRHRQANVWERWLEPWNVKKKMRRHTADSLAADSVGSAAAVAAAAGSGGWHTGSAD